MLKKITETIQKILFLNSSWLIKNKEEGKGNVIPSFFLENNRCLHVINRTEQSSDIKTFCIRSFKVVSGGTTTRGRKKENNLDYEVYVKLFIFLWL